MSGKYTHHICVHKYEYYILHNNNKNMYIPNKSGVSSSIVSFRRTTICIYARLIFRYASFPAYLHVERNIVHVVVVVICFRNMCIYIEWVWIRFALCFSSQTHPPPPQPKTESPSNIFIEPKLAADLLMLMLRTVMVNKLICLSVINYKPNCVCIC